MSVLIFIIVLAIIVVAHELGHFLVAKYFGVRVDEFGVGLPPKILTLWERGETKYTLNAIPFGGFVKIFGENPDDESLAGSDSVRSLANKNRGIQAAVLVAGVAFNIVFAWMLITGGFLLGMPAPVDYVSGEDVRDTRVVITDVLNGSPADLVGLKSGDVLVALRAGKAELSILNPEDVSKFVAEHGKENLEVGIARGRDSLEISVTPADGIIAGQKGIGISMDMIGILRLPLHKAIWQGAKTTYALTQATVVGLSLFIRDAFSGRSDISQITGPVGIVGIVGSVTELGFVYLISFMAFISINLAIINLIPFPALDGGRLLFVAIEAIKRSRINPKIANALNSIGFALLIILMLVVTYHDIVRLIR